MNTKNNIITAALIIGPTGAGKTPLGEISSQKGLWRKTCFHFDFGESLRMTAGGKKYTSLLSESDILYIQKVLQEGALLENETFYIAENILRSFISENKITANDLLILNGLPRHKDQAKDVQKIVDINTVIHITCAPAVILERIRLNTGGDRTERADDSLAEIENKLNIFNERTLPLIAYFKNQGAQIKTFDVGIRTTAEDLHEEINQAF